MGEEKQEKLSEQERVKKCKEEIDAALKKYHCIMDFEMTLSRMGMTPHIKIVPNLNLPDLMEGVGAHDPARHP
jgi:hypothetical protein